MTVQQLRASTLMAHQPHYFPRLYYVARALSAETVVLLETAQFTRRSPAAGTSLPSWQAHTLIKSPQGSLRLTIPVSDSRERICDTRIADHAALATHAASFRHAYGSAPFGGPVLDDIDELLAFPWPTLGTLTAATFVWALGRLGGLDCPVLAINRGEAVLACSRFSKLRTVVTDFELGVRGSGSGWMLDICKAAGATTYVCGQPAAEAYLDRAAFAEAGIDISVQDWRCPVYEQRWPPFVPNLSIVDLAANVGWRRARDLLT